MSIDRAYTVAEIDQLREVVENKWLWGTYRRISGAGYSRSYSGNEKTTAVEQLVRTHMLAGHTADDLLASEQGKPT